jgi:CRP-like cAMP-binding protein
VTVAALLAHDLPLFRGLVPADLAHVDVAFTERRLRPWEILFHQNDPGAEVHFLLSGTLIALYWTAEGREVIFTRFASGDHFGELAALDDGDRSLAVVARSDVALLTVPGPVFRAMFEQVPILRRRLS